MKKAILLALMCLLMFSLSVPLIAADPVIPKPDSQFYVLDEADVLNDETTNTIVQTSAALADITKAQIVVITVKSLIDSTPEDYALAILRQWGIGDKQLNNGVLILVVPDERVSRIEVGYGLEGALPDAKTGRIQDEYMIPYFREYNYNQGILNGYLAIVKEVAAEYKVSVETAAPQSGPVSSPINGEQSMPFWAKILIIIGIIILLILDQVFFGGFFLRLILSMLLRGGGSGGRGGGYKGGGGSGGGGGSSRRW